MKKRTRRAVFWLLLAVFLVSGSMAVYQQYQHHLGQQVYAQAEELAGLPDLTQLAQEEKFLHIQSQPQPPAQSESQDTSQEEPETVWVDPYADALRAMDFTALREVNEEVEGWILIPGTPISYPLMQAADNDKYLNRTWRNSRSSVGSIFLECQNSADLSDFNTMIYGHRTIDNSMFGSLKKYAKESYWRDRSHIYITNDEGCKTYQIFAAYEVGVTEQTYRLGFRDEGDKQEFLDFCLSQSGIQTGIVPTVNDRVITLSTCTGRGHATRWVVQAVLTEG